jgi:hypothetical protein
MARTSIEDGVVEEDIGLSFKEWGMVNDYKNNCQPGFRGILKINICHM